MAPEYREGPGSKREVRARHESTLSGSQGRSTQKAKEAGQKACYERVGSLASELGVSRPLSRNLSHSQSETLSIIQILGVVVPCKRPSC